MSTYEETVCCCTTGRGSQLCIFDKKHDELKSFGRLWYQEIRDFLIPGCTVPRWLSCLSALILILCSSSRYKCLGWGRCGKRPSCYPGRHSTSFAGRNQERSKLGTAGLFARASCASGPWVKRPWQEHPSECFSWAWPMWRTVVATTGGSIIGGIPSATARSPWHRCQSP